MTISRVTLLVSPLALVASLAIACGPSSDEGAPEASDADAAPAPTPSPSSSSSTEPPQPGKHSEEPGDAGADAPMDASADAAPHVPAPPGFATYCRGKLLRELRLAQPTPSGWGVTARSAAVGTEVLVANSGIWTPLHKTVRLAAFTIDTDGTPYQVTEDFTPLVAGVDLELSCATDAQPARVLLGTTHIYADKAHTGTPCVLPASLPVSGIDSAYLFGPEGTHLSGAQLTSYCGLQVGYSSDFPTANLLPK